MKAACAFAAKENFLIYLFKVRIGSKVCYENVIWTGIVAPKTNFHLACDGKHHRSRRQF